MPTDHWSTPDANILEGRSCRLEALSDTHLSGLYECTVLGDAEERFRYLPEYPCPAREEFDLWFESKKISKDPKYYVVVDKSTGKIGGRQTFMRITPEHGVIEIGHIYWSSLIARTTVTTEAIFLMLQYIFDGLKYRRCEW